MAEHDKTNDIGKEGADPWASDADWISNGGYDADVQKDIAAIQNLETPKPVSTDTESKG